MASSRWDYICTDLVLVAQAIFPLEHGHTQMQMPVITIPTHWLLPESFTYIIINNADIYKALSVSEWQVNQRG